MLSYLTNKRVQRAVKSQEKIPHHKTEANKNYDIHNRDKTDSYNHTSPLLSVSQCQDKNRKEESVSSQIP